MGGMRNACNILDGKPEGKRLFGRPVRRKLIQTTRKKFEQD
jgi:hypothetical protein